MSRPEGSSRRIPGPAHLEIRYGGYNTARSLAVKKVKGSRMIDFLEKLTIESNSSTSEEISSSEESTDDD